MKPDYESNLQKEIMKFYNYISYQL